MTYVTDVVTYGLNVGDSDLDEAEALKILASSAIVVDEMLPTESAT